ncbi:hypothetical protein ABB37_08168 [Leptomonas pyrrhocoris]|uniref:Transmembrane protein n=1 Tax=Leptomonas pyrrhocoris TaxID=157538 RepID=A0A0M9FUB6_LEPPY|nr:hypothetical protein ABB37_08168 [Leptomonas pyrrhocoris]KPA76026.1 hypothetical protein ABB37_08168 [Leptomonas pyrrhocoris]|eukprot:XP_015654465.1 hypothetical protein ABB37_08168 [Leptomonas pyrrhocoris]
MRDLMWCSVEVKTHKHISTHTRAFCVGQWCSLGVFVFVFVCFTLSFFFFSFRFSLKVEDALSQVRAVSLLLRYPFLLLLIRSPGEKKSYMRRSRRRSCVSSRET